MYTLRGAHGRFLLFCALSALTLTSCANQVKDVTAEGPEPPLSTYASLAPSNTELIYAIGAQDHLVAVSSECDYPPEAKALPKIGSFTGIDLERFAAVHPKGVFLVNSQEQLAAQIEEHKELNCQTAILNNPAVGDIVSNALLLGQMTNHKGSAQKATEKFVASLEKLKRVIRQPAHRPKVLLCIWPEPLTVVGKGSYLSDAIEICGGENAAAELKAPYAHLSTEEIIAKQPELIILPNELAGQKLFHKAPWSSLTAVKQKHVFFLPDRDHDHLSRPTLRIIDGLYWLAAQIHPELKKELDKLRDTK